jgi:hypothetical protein
MAEMAAALRDARLDDINRARLDGSRAARRIVGELREAFDRFVALTGADEEPDAPTGPTQKPKRRIVS